jgi:hypothetical protein
MTRQENANLRWRFYWQGRRVGWEAGKLYSLHYGIGGLSMENITPVSNYASFIV